jgi:hypothetical protein
MHKIFKWLKYFYKSCFLLDNLRSLIIILFIIWVINKTIISIIIGLGVYVLGLIIYYEYTMRFHKDKSEQNKLNNN